MTVSYGSPKDTSCRLSATREKQDGLKLTQEQDEAFQRAGLQTQEGKMNYSTQAVLSKCFIKPLKNRIIRNDQRTPPGRKKMTLHRNPNYINE